MIKSKAFFRVVSTKMRKCLFFFVLCWWNITAWIFFFFYLWKKGLSSPVDNIFFPSAKATDFKFSTHKYRRNKFMWIVVCQRTKTKTKNACSCLPYFSCFLLMTNKKIQLSFLWFKNSPTLADHRFLYSFLILLSVISAWSAYLK